MTADAATVRRTSLDPYEGSSWFFLLVRVHPFLVALIASGVLLRIVTIVAYQPALLFHADAYGYLRIAEDLEPSPYRPVLYPILLRLAFPLHSLLPVVVVQHLAGLAMGIAVYALLRRLGVGSFGGAVGSAPLFVDAYQLNIEQYVLSETLFMSLMVGSFFLLSAARKPSARAVGVAGTLLGLAGITRVTGVVLIVPVLVYLWWRKVGLAKILWCVGGFLLPLVIYAMWFLGHWGVFAITTKGSLILYGRVSPFANCAAAELPEYQRVLCDVRPPDERPGTEFYVWRTLNRYSPLLRLEPPPGRSEEEVLGQFARAIIVSQPLDYARVVVGDLAHYLAPGRWEKPRDAQIEPWEFTDSFDFGPDDPEVIKVLQTTGDNLPQVIRENRGSPEPNELFGDQPTPELEINAPLARFLASYQAIVYTPGPLVALAILLGIIGAALPSPRGRRR
ncbi:MAG TPA: glycosyltransferase family 39 protein, partial [Actinomycetota bacterium]|nr:glycosyltransferase family 39 protein [Actinomycetota bacterium]